ncbi:hypothetical protein [Ancylobacter oerskovii]|uniref:Uncharacterized protein n=1 Tax=Ancylobacter oerskovii TaxID=459519 RepID=A0ABW4Z1T9_9HYPH|nr:hypothetical protein [Ancylobacter oerskovii]MBS7545079.1 hypothetical protein [Ancylobacter oerskovii]
MAEEGEGRIVARFAIHICCDSCSSTSAKRLDVPDVEDAPTTVEELLESALLARQTFCCEVCESRIAYVTSIKRLREKEPIHA